MIVCVTRVTEVLVMQARKHAHSVEVVIIKIPLQILIALVVTLALIPQPLVLKVNQLAKIAWRAPATQIKDRQSVRTV